MLEYWFPAPLSEGDPGKNIAPPVELREPVGEELEFSSNSFMGTEPEVGITGASGPPLAGGPMKKRWHAMRKISASRLG